MTTPAPASPPPLLPVSEALPCPVCTAIYVCRRRRDGLAACCSMPDLLKEWRESRTIETLPGWSALREDYYARAKGDKKEPEFGVVLVRLDDAGNALVRPEELPDREERRRLEGEQFARQNTERGARLWHAAKGQDTRRVLEYLRARGIDGPTAAAVTSCLRFHERCPGERKMVGPAMLARISRVEASERGHRHLTMALHRTFLDPGGEPRKRTMGEEEGGPKQMLGPATGNAVWLARDFSPGAIVVAEGIETTAAAMQATALPGIALLSAHGMERWEIPPGLLDQGGPVSLVVIAADFNTGGIPRPDTRKRKIPELLAECTRLSRAEAEEIYGQPTGMRAARILKARLAEHRPWLTVFIRVPSAAQAPELFVGEKPKADWLEVLNAAGVEVVRSALLETVDVNAARHKASRWAPSQWAPIPQDRGDVGAGGTRAGAGGGGHGEPPSGPGAEDGDAKPWVTASIDDMPTIEDGSVVRARRFLWEQFRVPGQRRFGVAWWGGKWWLYDGTCYSEVPDDRVRSIAWHWLQEFRHYKGKRLVPLSPTARMAEELVKALAIDTWVDGDTIPAWLPPSIDAGGRPLWGSASSVSRIRGELAPSARGSARAKLIFPNGVLDFDRLVDKRLPIEERTRLEPHTPELFSATCLPFRLPVRELQALLRGEDRDEIYTQVCPKFYGWMADASDGDPGWEDQLLKMLGDTISLDRSIEKIFGVVGLGRGGKGIIEDAVTAIMGEQNVAALDSATLDDRFGLAHLVGKPVALMPDAQMDSFGNGSMRTERLKTMSGQGRMPIRDLYTRTTTHKACARIWIFMNQEPDLKDDSGALAGRFIWLPITKGYLGREDGSIKAAVPAEAPGIMLLAIEGAIRLWSMERRRIEMCGEGAQIAADFEEDSAPLRTFVSTWLEYQKKEPPAEKWPTSEELYEMYQAFSLLDETRKPLGKRKFDQRIKWHARPFSWAHPRVKDPKTGVEHEVKDNRKRRLRGWIMRPEKLQTLEEWKRRRPQDQQENLPRW